MSSLRRRMSLAIARLVSPSNQPESPASALELAVAEIHREDEAIDIPQFLRMPAEPWPTDATAVGVQIDREMQEVVLAAQQPGSDLDIVDRHLSVTIDIIDRLEDRDKVLSKRLADMGSERRQVRRLLKMYRGNRDDLANRAGAKIESIAP